jgi:hypothetical protein
MRTSSTASRRISVPLLFATVSLSLVALHCGGDEGGTGGTAGTATQPTSGTGGTASQGGSSSGMAAGGVMTAGSSSGGSATGGTATAGAAGTATSGGGAGGAHGGAGGSGGAGGGSGGSGGGGGSSPLFAAVKAQMAKTCGTGKCHNADSGELVFQMLDDATLYKNLTTPVPTGSKHCQGSTAIVANDANSLLLRAIKGDTTCMNNGASQNIAQMPDDCPDKGIACLTANEQKIFTDWVAAGAPK